MKNLISYLLILIGGSIAIYANASEKQNIILLIFGIIALMAGLFILNKKLSSKSIEEDKKDIQVVEEAEE